MRNAVLISCIFHALSELVIVSKTRYFGAKRVLRCRHLGCLVQLVVEGWCRDEVEVWGGGGEVWVA